MEVVVHALQTARQRREKTRAGKTETTSELKREGKILIKVPAGGGDLALRGGKLTQADRLRMGVEGMSLKRGCERTDRRWGGVAHSGRRDQEPNDLSRERKRKEQEEGSQSIELKYNQGQKDAERIRKMTYLKANEKKERDQTRKKSARRKGKGHVT